MQRPGWLARGFTLDILIGHAGALQEHKRALRDVEQAGRAAPADMRHLLDAMRPDGEVAGNGAGHGLIGIRERVRLYRGQLATSTPTGGGFLLSTQLPLGRSHR